MALTQVQPGMLGTTQPYNFKNRIINGAMVIDQRNAGGIITNPTSPQYLLDRFYYRSTSTTPTFNVQQNAGSVTPPAGFTNYLGVTMTNSSTPSSTDRFAIGQPIEGFNTADLNWGSTNAKTVTLSFWVYSSLTGTFGGTLQNSAQNYSYPFTYSIPVANTWTQIVLTIAGPTAGTWVGATNGVGIYVFWSLGTGSTLQGTAGSWSANTYWAGTGSTNIVSTNNATFYITGVQLELGVSATSFDYRPYGTELALCQRYYAIINTQNYSAGYSSNTSSAYSSCFYFPVTMRTTPTTITLPTAGQSTGQISFTTGVGGYPSATGTHAISASNTSLFSITGSGYTGLTSGAPAFLFSNGTCPITASAEL